MSKFFKDDKIARSQLGEYKVFVEFISGYLHQITLEIMLLLVNWHEKHIVENQNG